MVNKRMKARAVLALVRTRARRHGLRLEELKGRGKGSHRTYVLLDGEHRVGRFTITDHSGDMSRAVLQSIEGGLSGLFGEKWMEK